MYIYVYAEAYIEVVTVEFRRQPGGHLQQTVKHHQCIEVEAIVHQTILSDPSRSASGSCVVVAARDGKEQQQDMLDPGLELSRGIRHHPTAMCAPWLLGLSTSRMSRLYSGWEVRTGGR